MNRRSANEFLAGLIGLLLLALIGWGAYQLICLLVRLLSRADTTIAAAVVAGSLAILSSTIAVVVGRSFEARRDREAAHRERKTDTYDSFLKRLFEIFHGGRATEGAEDELIDFFRENSRKFLLWSGPGGLKAYSDWQDALKGQARNPKADSVIKMVDFFLALRKDLGHSNRGLKRDHLVGLVLRNPQLFMELYRRNPSISLAEIARAEQQLGSEG